MDPVGQFGQEANLVPAAVSEALAENMWWLGLESSEGLFSHISGTWTKITESLGLQTCAWERGIPVPSIRG